jgi:sulfide:quinone oxidoreductase
MERNVVVLGGGIGGVVAASRLSRELGSLDSGGQVVLVDRDAVHRFAPSFPWVMTGIRRPKQVEIDLEQLRSRGVTLHRAEALEIDPGARVVKTTAGALNYQVLVIALGAELAPEALPGFTEAAHNVYTLEGADAAGRALRVFEGGRVVVLVSRLPYRCPAAPYEAALLAESMLRERGVRGAAAVDVYTPEPQPMPTAGPVMGEALTALLSERGIGLHRQRTVAHIESGPHELVFTDGERVPYDLLLGVPPHRAPEAVSGSGLVAESGFLPVDRHTLAAGAEGVFAIGDIAEIPIAGGKFLPKAGVFARAEAKVVAQRIAREIAGRQPKAMFDGSGSCFVELGGGVAAYATGNFYPEEGPQVHLRRPGRRYHLAKVVFERYWLKRWFR